MVIDGYFAGRLSMGSLPEVYPITQVSAENRDQLHSLVEERWKSLGIGAEDGALYALLGELVTSRLSMKGFNEVEDQESVGKYLLLMLLNGVKWAEAEKDIIG